MTKKQQKIVEDLKNERKDLLDIYDTLSIQRNEVESEMDKKALTKKMKGISDRINEIDSTINSIVNNEEVEVKSKAKGITAKGMAGLLALAMGAGFFTGFAITSNKSKNNGTDKTSIVEVMETPNPSIGTVTDEAKAIEETTPVVEKTDVLEVPTETKDLVEENSIEKSIDNDDYLNVMTNRVFDEDYLNILSSTDNFPYNYNREDIADLIRFVHGRAPIGYGEEDFNRYASQFVYLYGYGFGQKTNDLIPLHYENLCVEDSLLADYCREYDEIYNRIFAYISENNVDGVVEEVGNLGYKLFNEWHKFGMNGGYNPYLFKDNELFLAFNASLARFSRVYGYLIDKDPICINTCYDVENKEDKLVNVLDVVEAIQYGQSKNGEIAILVGSEVFDPNKYVSEKHISALNNNKAKSLRLE